MKISKSHLLDGKTISITGSKSISNRLLILGKLFGDLKIENRIVEEENNNETEYYIEYYQNGFLKIEKTLINNSKNDIYREYFENGNVKYEGKFKNDKPIEKHYFYKEDGRIDKIETWKKDKLIPLKEYKYND